MFDKQTPDKCDITFVSCLTSWPNPCLKEVKYPSVSTTRTLGSLFNDFHQDTLQGTPYIEAISERFELHVVDHGDFNLIISECRDKQLTQFLKKYRKKDMPTPNECALTIEVVCKCHYYQLHVWLLNNNKVICLEIPSISQIIYIKHHITSTIGIPINCQTLIYENGTKMNDYDSIDEYADPSLLNKDMDEMSATYKALCYLAILPQYWTMLKTISHEISFETFDSDYNYKHFNNYSQVFTYTGNKQLPLCEKNKFENGELLITPLSTHQILALNYGDFVYFRINYTDQFRDAMVVECNSTSIKLQFIDDLVNNKDYYQHLLANKNSKNKPEFVTGNQNINQNTNKYKNKHKNKNQGISIILDHIPFQAIHFKTCFGKWWFDQQIQTSYHGAMFMKNIAKYHTRNSNCNCVNRHDLDNNGCECSRDSWFLLQKDRLCNILRQFFPIDICSILLQYTDCHQHLAQFGRKQFVKNKPLPPECDNLKEHEWHFIQLSHPLSLKRNNIFLLKLLNADCNHLQFKPKKGDEKNKHCKFQFEFGIICFDKLNIKAFARDSTIGDRKPYRMRQYTTYKHLCKIVRLQIDGVSARSFMFSDDTQINCNTIHFEKIHEQLLASKENEKNGIYLQFENTIYDAGKYELSFLIWNRKTRQFEMICDEKYVIDTQNDDCFVMLAAPICDCVGTLGFEYVIERIE